LRWRILVDQLVVIDGERAAVFNGAQGLVRASGDEQRGEADDDKAHDSSVPDTY
jgi:hypothetical protein